MPRESGAISRPSSSPCLFQRLQRHLGHEPPAPRSPTLCPSPGCAHVASLPNRRWSRGQHWGLPFRGGTAPKAASGLITENISWGQTEMGPALAKGPGSPGPCCWGLRPLGWSLSCPPCCFFSPPGLHALAGSEQLRMPSALSFEMRTGGRHGLCPAADHSWVGSGLGGAVSPVSRILLALSPAAFAAPNCLHKCRSASDTNTQRTGLVHQTPLLEKE